MHSDSKWYFFVSLVEVGKIVRYNFIGFKSITTSKRENLATAAIILNRMQHLLRIGFSSERMIYRGCGQI